MSRLCIFSDASIFNDTRTNTFTGCPGAIAIEYNNTYPNTFNNPIIETNYQILTNTTNNRSEMQGIIMALQLQNKYRYIYDQIDIYSDSAICVKSLRDWIYGWNNSSQPYFCNSSDEYVKNQDMVKFAVYYILNNDLDVNIHHCRGHMDIKRESDITKARKAYLANNNTNINIAKDDLITILYYNNMVDEETRRYLQCFLQSQVPISYQIHHEEYDKGKLSSSDIKKYKTLMHKESKKPQRG